jgi:predicted MFS family arabinose efflux permease
MAPVSERTILFLVAAVQFVNIIDFMMVMPMGPDFAKALAIPTSSLGLIGGSYTAAAAVSGLVCSTFLDRYDRRTALSATMLGLVLATAGGGIAVGFHTLLIARVLAGAFGGPSMSLCMSIVADVIPPERRGRAMGVVMSSFAIASVLGVPVGLELARLWGWRTPFFAVAALGAVVAGCALWLMPSLRLHLAHSVDGELPPMRETLERPVVWIALCATFVMAATMFALVPNLSAYLQYNAGMPRDQLGFLYLVGGLASFASMNVVGRMIDRFGSPAVAAFGTAVYTVMLYLGFVKPPNTISPMTLFVGWMAASAFRNVPANALFTRVPRPMERARFMSLNSAVQQIACAVGAMASAAYLTERPDHGLVGMDVVAWIAIVTGLTYPLMMVAIDRDVQREMTKIEPPPPPARIP